MKHTQTEEYHNEKIKRHECKENQISITKRNMHNSIRLSAQPVPKTTTKARSKSVSKGTTR